MQRVAFYAVIVAGDAGIGIMRRADAHLMPARKAQTKTQSVFKLEG